MIQEIFPDLYRSEIPLPGSPLKALNSYLIKSQERFLVIDTGMNREECKREMLANLAKLDVEPAKTDFLITHLHADHVGLTEHLLANTSRVYMGALDADIINNKISENRWLTQAHNLETHGFPTKEVEKALAVLPGRKYGPAKRLDISYIRQGDILNFGDYSFCCVHTPGHTPGHICLYEANKKILICGDHILGGITPNIGIWPEAKDSLKDYLESLDRVYALEANLILPGHRKIFKDHRKRIAELRQHHQARLSEVIVSLSDSEKTAFQVAPHISWDIDYASWEEFPPLQKWFAMGETLAHLIYLEGTGKVKRRTKGNMVMFSLN